jgi:1-acyl-sn-glycerol-3-phosphate acyltransferase
MRTVIGYIITIVASVVLITSSIIAYFLSFFNSNVPLVMARTMWAPIILKAFGVSNYKVNGIDNIPKGEPLVIVSNHQSQIDIPIIFKALPINLRFVAKESLKKVPFLGQYMTMTKMVFINRSDKRKASNSMKSAALQVSKGSSVIIFPEGTRSINGELGDFKMGAFVLAKNANVNILPVAIKGSFEIFPSNTFFFKPGNVTVEIGKPISSNDDAKITKDAVRTSILTMLN